MAFSLGVVLSMAVAALAGADEILDRVLAVVAGDVIMLSDVAAARDLGLVQTGGAPDPTREILTRLIERSLILAEVDRYGPPEPSAEAIAAASRAVAARFSSPQEFARALGRVGLDERRLGELLRQNLRIQAYLDQRFSTDTPERRLALIDEWVAGLRRRADIVDLYAAAP